MNQNTNTSNTNQSTGTMNETNREPAKLITLTAFLAFFIFGIDFTSITKIKCSSKKINRN